MCSVMIVLVVATLFLLSPVAAWTSPRSAGTSSSGPLSRRRSSIVPLFPRCQESAVLVGSTRHPSDTGDWLAEASTPPEPEEESTSTVAVPPDETSGAAAPSEEREEEEDCPSEEECEIDWSRMPGGGGEEEEEQTAAPASSAQQLDWIAAMQQEDDQLIMLTTEHDDEPTTTPFLTSSLASSSSPLLRVTPPVLTASSRKRNDPDDDDDDDDHHQDDGAWVQKVQQGAAHVDQLRRRLEMHWQLREVQEECDVYRPESCGSEPCTTCQGQGWTACRFCRGTTVLWLRPSTVFTACPVCQQGMESCRPCRGSGWIASWTRGYNNTPSWSTTTRAPSSSSSLLRRDMDHEDDDDDDDDDDYEEEEYGSGPSSSPHGPLNP